MFDFHREKHYVSSEMCENNNKTNKTNEKNIRLVLKLHYIIGDSSCPDYKMNLISYLTKLFSFDITRTAMSFSKNPSNIFEKIVGNLCDVGRRINNY